MTRKLYRHLAGRLAAMRNCVESKNVEWYERHKEVAESLVKNRLPSGAGFDSGTALDLLASDPERLEFSTSFHHMNDSGMYDGWTEHRIVVTPSLVHGFDLRITGRERRGIKDYIAEVFADALNEEVGDDEIKGQSTIAT